MAFENRGTLIQSGNVMQINNGLVEEVSSPDTRTGSLLISYVHRAANGTSSIRLIQLNVVPNTAILNLTGGSNCICDIEEGMWVDALFSSRMTRSIPPQSNAFLLIVRRGLVPSSLTTTTAIISVDPGRRFILTGIPGNPNRQILFNLTANTILRDREGSRLPLTALQPGQPVRVVHANFETASIPPQTTAFFIQLI